MVHFPPQFLTAYEALHCMLSIKLMFIPIVTFYTKRLLNADSSVCSFRRSGVKYWIHVLLAHPMS